MMFAARRHGLALLIEAPSRWDAWLAWIAEGRKRKIYGSPIVAEASQLTAEDLAKCEVLS